MLFLNTLEKEEQRWKKVFFFSIWTYWIWDSYVFQVNTVDVTNLYAILKIYLCSFG